jgi:hypothetical protein
MTVPTDHSRLLDTDHDYPIRVDDTTGCSRWLVRRLPLLPHFLLLTALWTAAVTLTALAGFAVLYAGRYPVGTFDFVARVLR